MSDYFNEFLVNEWNALDKELSQDNFLTREQERQEQRQQQELQKSHVDDSDKDQITQDDLHPPYDRRRSKESKQERLERIKQEYSRPFVSVGQISQRRQDRKKRLIKLLYPQNLQQDPVEEGLMANSPNFTQLHEQNEATIMPIAKLKGFCK